MNVNLTSKLLLTVAPPVSVAKYSTKKTILPQRGMASDNFLVEYLATETGGAIVNSSFEVILHTQKLTNFKAVFIVERVAWGKSDPHGKA